MAKAALSGMLSQVRGRVGEDVLVRTRSGIAVRQRPKYKQFPNPATEGARARLLAAKDAWNEMNSAQVAEWRDYARTQIKVSPTDGSRYSPIAYNAFVGLATRYLQASPTSPIPLVPPTEAFTGDRVTLTLVGIEGGVRVVPSGPNSPGVTTEILMQVLPNERRSPTKFYKSLLFHVFTNEPLDIPLPKGVFAFSTRFVQLATGQASGELLLGTVILDE